MLRARTALVAAALALAAPAASAVPAHAARASIHPSFAPDRLGARTALTFSVALRGDGEEAVPPPLSGLVMRLPAGLGIDVGGARACRSRSLASRGPSACPTASLVGRGHSVLEVHAGSQTIPEEASMWAFRTPDRGGHPALSILGRGQTPLQQSSVSTGVLLADHAPYGSRLSISIPPIPTLRFEPDASILSMSLTVGAPPSPRAHAATAAVTVPRRCPRGGFPFAAEFTFADETVVNASTRVPCP